MQELHSTQVDVQTWHYVLKRFTKLETFRTLMSEARKENNGLLRPVMSRTFVEPDYQYIMPRNSPRNEYVPITPVLESLLEPTDPEICTRNCSRGLNTLHLEGVDSQKLLGLSYLDFDWRRAFAFFRDLRDLRLDLGPPERAPSLSGIEGGALNSLVTAVKGIRNFRLSWLVDDWGLRLTDVFQEEQTWPELTNVELHGVAFKASELESFISRHQTSLRQLTIGASQSQLSRKMVAEDEDCAGQWILDVFPVETSTCLGSVLDSAKTTRRAEMDGRSLTVAWS